VDVDEGPAGPCPRAVNGARDQAFAGGRLSADENCRESTADLTACDQALNLIALGLNGRALTHQLCQGIQGRLPTLTAQFTAQGLTTLTTAQYF
jgi:hypothetical protein